MCPNPDQVKRAIELRNRLELAWTVALGGGAVAAIAWLAHWSNTF
jgi:hypothetical protein